MANPRESFFTSGYRFWWLLRKNTQEVLRLRRLSVSPKSLGNNLVVALWNAFKIALKESVTVYGFLDYPRRPIFMEVNSMVQIGRLRACAKEPDTIQWLESHIRPGDVFYDVGANVGAYSFVAWAKTEGRCMVYAFEPSFSTFAALNHNIFFNNASREITAFPIALGEKTQLVDFQYADIAPGSAGHNAPLGKEPTRPFQSTFVQPLLGYRLDDLIDRFNLRPPNLIKIDTDGQELAVIRGAEETLRGPQLRTLQIEIDHTLPGWEEIMDRITNAGFIIHSRRKFHGKETFNYVFGRV